MSVDPLAGDFPSWTPYHYVHNNPLRYTDPTGMSAEGADGIESIHKDKNGNVIAEIDDGDDNVYVHNDLDMKSGQHIDGTLSQLSQKRDMYGTSGGGEKDSWGSFVNKVSKMFEEGDQQQHSGENWFVYGKGSKNGWSIKAPKPDPDGVNKSIDISDMLTPGRFSKENLPAGVGGFIENVSNAADMIEQNRSPEKPEKDTMVIKFTPIPGSTEYRRDTIYSSRDENN